MVCLLKRYGSSHFDEVFSFVSATGYCTSSRGEFPFHHPWWHCNGKLSHSWQWLRRLQWCTRSIFLTQIESKCWDWEEHRHVHQTNSNPCFVILLELLGNAECTGKKCIKRSSNRSWTYRMYYMYRIHIACICTCRNLSVHSCAFVALELDPLSNSASFASTETGLAPRFRSSLEHPFTRDIARQKTWYMVTWYHIAIFFLRKKHFTHFTTADFSAGAVKRHGFFAPSREDVADLSQIALHKSSPFVHRIHISLYSALKKLIVCPLPELTSTWSANSKIM